MSIVLRTQVKMTENFTFYDTVHELLTIKGITVAQMERDLGMARHHAKKWKQSLPSYKSLIMLADYFGVSIDYLLGRDQSMTPDEIQLLSEYSKLADEQKNAVHALILGFLAQAPVKKDAAM